jgi:hypothetical protein
MRVYNILYTNIQYVHTQYYSIYIIHYYEPPQWEMLLHVENNNMRIYVNFVTITHLIFLSHQCIISRTVQCTCNSWYIVYNLFIKFINVLNLNNHFDILSIRKHTNKLIIPISNSKPNSARRNIFFSIRIIWYPATYVFPHTDHLI